MNFPELTDSFLAGQDVLYTQFNDLNFYVEDTDQENLYYHILKKIFSNIRFSKIFPLNGKGNLKIHAKQNLTSTDKIYIADLDFDDILGSKETITNVFYLDKYSIENYLCSKDAIYELIKEKQPKLKDRDISNLVCINEEHQLCKKLLKDLAMSFVVIQKHELGLTFYGLNPSSDFILTADPCISRNNNIRDYLISVENKLKDKDTRYSINGQKRQITKYFTSKEKALKNIPGKYLLNLIYTRLKTKKLINQMSLETFTYKLAKETPSSYFIDLKNEIIASR